MHIDIFIDNYISLDVILDILFFKSIAGYSEFLLSFAFIYILIYLFKDIFNKMNNKILLLLIIVSLLMTYFNYELINNNIIGVLLGTDRFNCFSIIQYLCYYFLGIFIAKNKIIFNKFILLLLSLISNIILNNEFPERFPPSIYFIFVGFLFVYLLYLLCNKMNVNRIIDYISNIGNNTLSYLVISNIVIFYFKRLMLNHSILFDKTWEFFFITSFIFMICIILSYLYNYIFLNIKVRINNCKKYRFML